MVTHHQMAALEHPPAPTPHEQSCFCLWLAWTAAVALHLQASAGQSPALSPARGSMLFIPMQCLKLS